MRFFFLTGMGATSEMYEGPWRSLPDAVFLDWPAYEGETELGQLADRLVGIAKMTAKDIPIGSSLGGMVALEIASQLRTRAVGLIASAKDPDEIHPFARTLLPLASIAPIRLTQLVAGTVAGDIGRRFMAVEPAFIKAMSRAILSWNPPEFRGQIVRIHGAKDHLIPCPLGAFRIEDAGHLVAISHPAECIQALQDLLEQAGVAL